MDNTNNTTAGSAGESIDTDVITITEALNRLGDQRPARQSFYEAINKGKIEKATNPEDADGKIWVRWSSVVKYVGGGGFKLRGKRAAANVPLPETDSVAAALRSSVESTPAVESNISANAAPAAAPAAAPVAAPAAQQAHEVQAKLEPKSTTRRHAKGDSKPSGKAASTRNGPAEPLAEERLRRRKIKTTKNSLRGLNFDETKEIRDWLDNRLLHVLRPDKAPTAA